MWNEDIMDNLAIRVEDVCKVYKLYDKPLRPVKGCTGTCGRKTVSKNIRH